MAITVSLVAASAAVAKEMLNRQRNNARTLPPELSKICRHSLAYADGSKPARALIVPAHRPFAATHFRSHPEEPRKRRLEGRLRSILSVIPGAKHEPGIHTPDRGYGFRACAWRRIPE